MIMTDYEERGIKKGKQLGRLEGLQLGILGLHSKNVPVEEIVELLKVDEKFVRKTIGNATSQKIKKWNWRFKMEGIVFIKMNGNNKSHNK